MRYVEQHEEQDVRLSTLVVCDGVQDTVGMLLLMCLEDAAHLFVNVLRVLDLTVPEVSDHSSASIS